MPTLHFADRTPFADGATQAWLREFGGRGGEGAKDGGLDTVETVRAEAESVLARSGLREALEHVRNASQGASTRDRFRLRLLAAGLSEVSSQHGLALTILDALVGESEGIALADWDPSLAFGLWHGVYRCARHLAQDPGYDDAAAPDLPARAAAAFGVLCRLDPAAALAARDAAASGEGGR